MPNSLKKKSVNVDRQLIEKFEYIYPKLKEIFINRCIDLAINDTTFFNDVFFNQRFMFKENV